jgi:DNA-binding PadR family transcriptional regulator
MLTEAPMHAYRMQQLIKERHKGDVVNVSQRNSVYQTIQRLLRDELIEVASTERAENRPERTTYQITSAGRAILESWLLDMVSSIASEFPEFPAALSFLPNLTTAQATTALEDRLAVLDRRHAAITAEMAEAAAFLPRLFLIETEYQQQMMATELGYLRALVADLRAGTITWPAPFRAEEPREGNWLS